MKELKKLNFEVPPSYTVKCEKFFSVFRNLEENFAVCWLRGVYDHFMAHHKPHRHVKATQMMRLLSLVPSERNIEEISGLSAAQLSFQPDKYVYAFSADFGKLNFE